MSLVNDTYRSAHVAGSYVYVADQTSGITKYDFSTTSTTDNEFIIASTFTATTFAQAGSKIAAKA